MIVPHAHLSKVTRMAERQEVKIKKQTTAELFNLLHIVKLTGA